MQNSERLSSPSKRDQRPSVGLGQQASNRPSAKSSAYEQHMQMKPIWQVEKNQMQQTIIALGEEVEYLSVRNQKMLQDLKHKDPFYETYVKTSEELTKLR